MQELIINNYYCRFTTSPPIRGGISYIPAYPGAATGNMSAIWGDTYAPTATPAEVLAHLTAYAGGYPSLLLFSFIYFIHFILSPLVFFVAHLFIPFLFPHLFSCTLFSDTTLFSLIILYLRVE